MADNPRELIRAAQAAELQGNTAHAAECLHQAAGLYQKAGNAPRALQLLRHALRLDGSRGDIAEEVNRLEWMPETLLARPLPVDEEESRLTAELERALEGSPPELARRQRLIEAALRAVGEAEEPGATREWVLDEPGAGDLQSLEVELARVALSTPSPPLPEAEGASTDSTPLDRNPHPVPLPEGEGSGLTAETQGRGRRGGQRLIERGPARADPMLDAWCSFCCRPRTEVGEVVAGPAGAFICKACLTESASLLGDVMPVPRPMPPRPTETAGATLDLVGQEGLHELLDRSLQAGARCLLVVGPEGCGKSVLFQSLQRQGRGVVTPVDALDQATSGLLLVEDVDRLDADAQAALTAFLMRHPERTVLLSARGTSDSPGLTLRGDAGQLSVPTTAALTQAVRGSIPVAVLEQVQVLLPLRAPTQSDYLEIARRRLALRSPAVSVSEDVLAAFAAEAVRSPRAGHELHALLSRVPAGAWSLEPVAKPARPHPRGRRKGTP